MSQLTIFKASAGSGKTFRLVAEYLKLLAQNPYNYRHILAVTFTNKATAEMKERIIRDLYKLAIGGNENLLQLIANETSLSYQKIIEHAKLALSFILHDYDRFSVNTIDSFFQRVLRSFARESGLYGAYEVELDHDAVLNEACDRLLMSVETDPELRIWLTEMSEDQLGEGKSWQIHDKIIELGKELQKEPFQLFMSHQVSLAEEREKLKNLRSELAKSKKWFENQLHEYGRKGLAIMEEHGLLYSDFKGGTRSFTNYFNYWSNGRLDKLSPTNTLLSAIDNPDEWSVQKSPKRLPILACVNSGLNDCLKETVQFLDKNKATYLTAVEISKHIYALGVLSTLAMKVRETGLERNSLMLTEADLLLKGIIGNNDAPFVYEKAGTFYQHFMIDEFQDTSVVQWDNFKPLVVNSLAENHNNLVVGDVKQSIYRWRNSNWQLLNREIKHDLVQFGVNEITLDTNWRSSKNVVDFNNFLFENARNYLQSEFNNELLGSNLKKELIAEYSSTINNAYADVKQMPMSGIDNGFIQCCFFDNEDKVVYSENVLEKLLTSIELVQEKGFKARDIAILVKKNQQGKMIAEAIINHKKLKGNPDYCYEVISDDSLFIQSSPAVRFLIGLLRYLTNPVDKVVQAAVVNEYSTHLLPVILDSGFQPQRVTISGQQSLEFETVESAAPKLIDASVVADYFPFFNDQANNSMVSHWVNRPLIDLVNELENQYLLSVIPGEQANLQSFKDVVADFVLREGGNMHKFLEWWEQFGHKVKLQTANQQNAIRILSIHKSKGLEFPIVMVPFCDWSFPPEAKFKNILWCSTLGTPYKEFPVLPINFSKAMGETLFAHDYFNELLLSYIDNFNVLYVALTRAVHGLFLITPLARPNTKENVVPKTVANLLWQLVNDGAYLEKKEENVYETGRLVCPDDRKVEIASEVNLSAKVNLQRKIGETLKIRNNYDDFLSETPSKKLLSINEGKLMHDILSRIITGNDMSGVIDLMIAEGVIDAQLKDGLLLNLDQLLKNSLADGWFSGKYKVLNETTIVMPNGSLLRPDRVMLGDEKAIVVDYKTTVETKPYHNKQVRSYMHKLKAMGYHHVEGWVWYLKSNQLVVVNFD